jgi:hypothetical protein
VDVDVDEADVDVDDVDVDDVDVDVDVVQAMFRPLDEEDVLMSPRVSPWPRRINSSCCSAWRLPPLTTHPTRGHLLVRSPPPRSPPSSSFGFGFGFGKHRRT